MANSFLAHYCENKNMFSRTQNELPVTFMGAEEQCHASWT